MRQSSACGPLQTLSVRFRCSGAATRHPRRAQRATSAGFASLRLPCAARVRGPAAQLPALAALSLVKHVQRVSARSARVRARASHPVLLGASHALLARPGCPVAEPKVVCGWLNTAPRARKAPGAAWAGRIGAAEKRRAPGRARTRALRDLTCGRLSERRERSERSEFGHGPGDRASQGTRSEAKGKPFEPRPGRARRLARADESTKQQTIANSRNGPTAALCAAALHPSRAARRAMSR